jgi:hypothetical protein
LFELAMLAQEAVDSGRAPMVTDDGKWLQWTGPRS